MLRQGTGLFRSLADSVLFRRRKRIASVLLSADNTTAPIGARSTTVGNTHDRHGHNLDHDHTEDSFFHLRGLSHSQSHYQLSRFPSQERLPKIVEGKVMSHEFGKGNTGRWVPGSSSSEGGVHVTWENVECGGGSTRDHTRTWAGNETYRSVCRPNP